MYLGSPVVEEMMGNLAVHEVDVQGIVECVEKNVLPLATE